MKAGKAYHSLVDQQLELLQVETNRRAVSELSEIEQEAEAIAGRAYNAGESVHLTKTLASRRKLSRGRETRRVVPSSSKKLFLTNLFRPLSLSPGFFRFSPADKKFRVQKATTKDLLLAAQDQLEALDNETRETFMQRKEVSPSSLATSRSSSSMKERNRRER